VDNQALNLIIIDDSFDTEEKIISTLRDKGYATRSSRVEDEEDLIAAIKTRAPDLILYTQGMDLISLKQTCECIKENINGAPVPVVAVERDESTVTVVEAMRDGAVDLSTYKNIKHLVLVINREVTAYRNWAKTSSLQTAYEESEQRCSSLLDSSRDAIAYIHEGMHVYSNASYLELFGIDQSDDLEGIPILDMVAQDDRSTFKTFLRSYMEASSGIEKLETHLRKPGGTEFAGEMEFSRANVEGEPCIQIIIRQDVRSSEELEKQLKLLSQKDQLTGLFNRQYSMDILEETISECESGEKTAALMEIRVDNYDAIKDSIGVVGADKFIVGIAKILGAVTHKNKEDILSRYMHSSFTLITYNKNQEALKTYAKELQFAISSLEANINDQHVSTTCSIGVTLIFKDAPECNEVFSRAEKATDEASALGNNQLKIYIPKEGELTRQESDTKLKEQLTDALKNDKFVLHFQPIVSLHGDTDERYEVFVRLSVDGSDRLIMPSDFLPAAERIGMSTAIDRWILYRTVTVLHKRWKAGKHTRFFVKLSASSLKDDTLIEWLGNQIKEKQLPENCLIFEVKETVVVTNLAQAKVLTNGLKSIKCGFVLDDFGVGSNPFQLLDHISVDYIRIERGFMENLLEDTQHQETIRLFASKASERGKYTIAQFVPDAASLSILWGMGVNFIQGYFLQEPHAELTYDFTEMGG